MLQIMFKVFIEESASKITNQILNKDKDSFIYIILMLK